MTMNDISSAAAEQVYGLLGYPLGHSFSARYFAEKFAREGRSAVYLNFELPDVERLQTEVLARYPRLRGFNVTIPHKQSVIPLLDELAPEARAIGAVNVVCVEHREGKPWLVGHNSDYLGFADSLQPLLQADDREALVLGTGGASKAVVYALRQLGLQVNRVSRRASATAIAYEDLTPGLVGRCTVVVNCTPLGMSPHTDTCPDLPYHWLTPRHLLYDLVYNPAETLFLRKGKAQGCRTKNGAEMLERQALAAWDFWQNGCEKAEKE